VSGVSGPPELRFGAFVPQGFMLELGDVPVADLWRVNVEHARAIEELGLDGLWVSDHVHNAPWIDHGRPPGTPKRSTPVLECWSLLAGLSQHTSRIRLGQLATCNSFRPPALLAKIAATVDHMSGGRIDLGLGAGWFEREHLGYGVPFPGARTRIEMLGEAVEIIRLLWSEPEVTFSGSHYTIDRGRCDPKPLQARVPLVIGGSGPTTLGIVAARADTWNYVGSLDDLPATKAKLEARCDAAGRPFEEIRISWFETGIVIRRDEDEARRIVEDLRARRGIPEFRSWLWGTPAKVQDAMGQFVELGVSELVPQFGDHPDTTSLELYATEVVPGLRPTTTAEPGGRR